jgi:hypothetical protein
VTIKTPTDTIEMADELTPFQNAVAGANGALFANLTIFPLDV